MTLMRRSAIGIAAGLALVLGPPGAGAQSPPPIKVGFSSAMTGPSAITGEGVKWAAQMLADVYASDRALAPGDLIRFDLGCVYQGYRSDIARTAVLGTPSGKQRRYYDAARDGEQAAIAAMKPGVAVSHIFEVAMRVTREHGMPHYERHHVGHGIGLEPYDPPTINAATTSALESGMVFCVERPYYEHGWGGVQVEDAVEITATGARRLTRSSQDLRILG